MSRFWKVALCICLALVLAACWQSNEKKYEAAEALVAEGKYDEAITAFEGLKGFGDSGKYITYTSSACSWATAGSMIRL